MAIPTLTLVSPEPEPQPSVDALRDFITARLAELGTEGKPMSAREATRRSGGLLSYETMRLLISPSRHRGKVTDRVAEGLSRALQVPVERIYRVAGIPPQGAPWEWPERFRRLIPAERREVEAFAAALLNAYDRGRNDRA